MISFHSFSSSSLFLLNIRLFLLLFLFSSHSLSSSSSSQLLMLSNYAGTGMIGWNGENLPATSSEIMSQGIWIDSLGTSIYLADNTRIRKINRATSKMITIAGQSIYMKNPTTNDNNPATLTGINNGMKIWGDNNGRYLYLVDKEQQRIRKLNLNTGIINTVIGNGLFGFNGHNLTGTASRISYPSSIWGDSLGNLMFTDTMNHYIRKLLITTNKVIPIAGTGSSGWNNDGIATLSMINSPWGIIGDSNGFIYFSDTLNYRIRKINYTNNTLLTIAGNGISSCTSTDNIAAISIAVCNPTGLWLNSLGDLYYADLNYRVRKIDHLTSLVTNIAGNGNVGFSGDGGLPLSATFHSITDLWGDSTGLLFIVDKLNYRIRLMSLLGNLIWTFAGNGFFSYSGDGDVASNAQLSNPSCLWGDLNGNILIGDNSNAVVRQVITSTNIISTIGGIFGVTGYSSTPVAFSSTYLSNPVAMWGDTNGNLFIIDSNRLRRVDVARLNQFYLHIMLWDIPD